MTYVFFTTFCLFLISSELFQFIQLHKVDRNVAKVNVISYQELKTLAEKQKEWRLLH